MATVFLARDHKHKRPVALKVLQPEVAHLLGPDRFLREIELAARLQHPHILTVFDSGNANGYLWFTMPFVEGESLRDRLGREKQLGVADALRIATEAARALEYAHQHGVVHRDIKPENILLTRDGSTLVADFGIALPLGGEYERLTETGLTVGTLAYMSPEQAAGDKALDGRSDLYSLASVLFEMLAGQPPFTGATHAVLARQLITTPAPQVTQFRGEVPASVTRTLAQSLAKNPADRFASLGEFAAALERAARESRASRPVPQALGGRLAMMVVGMAVALVLAVVWWRGRSRGGLLPEADSPRSIAVLPFRNLRGDSTGDYFSEGVTEEILNALTQIPDLRVAARTSAFQFGNRVVDVREVGERLNVGAVLEGSIQREGDAVRITSRLINTRTGYQMWSGKFDRRVADLFAIEDEISRALADTLKVSLGLASRPTRPAPSADAHDLYLRGLAHLARRGPGLRQAVAQFTAALAADSTYAQAWAGLAAAYELLPAYYLGSYAEALPLAERAARRAVALDSTLGPAWAVLGSVHRDRQQWAESDLAYGRALKYAPNDPETVEQYGQFLFWTGQAEAALPWMERARSLDPLAPIPTLTAGVARLFLRQYDSAETNLTRAADLGPDLPIIYMWQMWTALCTRRYDWAERAARRLAVLGGAEPEVYATLVRGVADPAHRQAALDLLSRTPGDSARWALNTDYRANWYTLLGDTATALTLVERLKSRPTLNAVLVLWNPALDPIRNHPRFRGTLEKLGLPYKGRPSGQASG